MRPKSVETFDIIFGSVILIYLQIQWPMHKQYRLLEDLFHVFRVQIVKF